MVRIGVNYFYSIDSLHQNEDPPLFRGEFDFIEEDGLDIEVILAHARIKAQEQSRSQSRIFHRIETVKVHNNATPKLEILVVNSDSLTLRIWNEVLISFGMSFQYARSQKAAREVFSRTKLDIVIIDFAIDSYGDGVDFVRWLVGQGYTGVMVANSSYDTENTTLLDAGCHIAVKDRAIGSDCYEKTAQALSRIRG